jgi:hypothetical protein
MSSLEDVELKERRHISYTSTGKIDTRFYEIGSDAVDTILPDLGDILPGSGQCLPQRIMHMEVIKDKDRGLSLIIIKWASLR